MPNQFRKEGASGGRVSGNFNTFKRAPKDVRVDDLKRVRKNPASSATRQKPLPTPPKGTSPMQPKPMNTAPHGTKAIKAKYASATDEEY